MSTHVATGTATLPQPDRFAITPAGRRLLQQLFATAESYWQRHKRPPTSTSLRHTLLSTLEFTPKTSEELLEYFTFPEKDWPIREERLQKAATREFNWLLSRGFVIKMT